MRFLAGLSAGAVIGLFASQAHATAYNFEFTFDGSMISLDAGSDTPGGTDLMIGDTFMIDVSAASGAFWRVDAAYSEFVPLSFAVSDLADREVNLTATFLRNGLTVATIADPGLIQSSIHVGGQQFDLALGLEFDQVLVDWEFLSITPDVIGQDTTVINTEPGFFNAFGDPERPFYNASEISFIRAQAMPVAGSLPLMAGALVAFGVVARRRNR
jgi:hypothetical protein